MWLIDPKRHRAFVVSANVAPERDVDRRGDDRGLGEAPDLRGPRLAKGKPERGVEGPDEHDPGADRERAPEEE
jgi:hypothetical protein